MKLGYLACLWLIVWVSEAAAQPFFLPTGVEPYNTFSPTVEADAVGGLHMVYPAYVPADAFYATCPSDCTSPEQVKVVVFPTPDDGTVHNIMLTLDATAVPQVLISTAQTVYYGTCTGDCREQSAWKLSKILEHGGEREVTGEAFALDPQGRPRFVMHSYRAYLGIGAPEPGTFYVLCDAECHNPSSWHSYKISPQVWQENTLRFDASGVAHLATVVGSDVGDIAAYLECATDCTNEGENTWHGAGLAYAFSSRYVEQINPAVSMVLTPAGAPRLAVLGNGEGGRYLAYYACDTDCTNQDGSTWQRNVLFGADAIGDGLDLALDMQGNPRLAYTYASHIFVAFCNQDCFADDDASWGVATVEMSSELPPDTVIPYADCNIAAWFSRQPSLAIGLDGMPRVAYRAEDISGGGDPLTPDYKPKCRAGADMTLNRFVSMTSYATE